MNPVRTISVALTLLAATFAPSAGAAGLTEADVARRAEATSVSVSAARAALAEATEGRAGASALWAPRLQVSARYARLSDFTQPAVGSGRLVGTTAPAGTPNPPSAALGEIRFANILDQYWTSAGVLVPVSDYFLRIAPANDAAAHAVDAAGVDVRVARARAETDGKVLFWAWVRAREAVSVAEASKKDRRAQLQDVEALASAERVTQADVLRAKAGVARAELGIADAQREAAVLERQIRVLVHAREDEPLVPSASLGEAPPRVAVADAASLVASAQAARLEVKSLDANAGALRAQARVARASQLPTVALFADGIYANPNPRYAPPTDKWLGTWDAGVSVTWSPNDVPIAGAAGRAADAKVDALLARRAELLDGIAVQVQRAREDVVRSDVAVSASAEALAAAEEAYRVGRVGLVEGRVTPAVVTDLETDLTRARLDVVDARSDAHVARARLAYALGAWGARAEVR